LVGCSGRHWRPRSGATRGAAMATRRAILAKRWQALGCAADGLYSPAMPRRIAIVEDDPTIRANYAEALRKHGFEVAAYAERAGLAARRAGGEGSLGRGARAASTASLSVPSGGVGKPHGVARADVNPRRTWLPEVGARRAPHHTSPPLYGGESTTRT